MSERRSKRNDWHGICCSFASWDTRRWHCLLQLIQLTILSLCLFYRLLENNQPAICRKYPRDDDLCSSVTFKIRPPSSYYCLHPSASLVSGPQVHSYCQDPTLKPHHCSPYGQSLAFFSTQMEINHLAKLFYRNWVRFYSCSSKIVSSRSGQSLRKNFVKSILHLPPCLLSLLCRHNKIILLTFLLLLFDDCLVQIWTEL